ncbi:MAG: TrmH family RNA methyltransferase [Brevinema sp.]
MINPRKFALLGTKQKIYKIAATIRNIEISLKQGQTLNIQETLAYTEVIKNQEGQKILRTVQIIDSIRDIQTIASVSEQAKLLNFAYHDLLDILDQKADEDKKFSFMQFDDLNKEATRYPWIGILDNLRSPMNVGTIFRSADGFGTGELFLTGITPYPPNTKVTRTALGAEEFVPFRYFNTTEEAIHQARKENYKIIALEVAAPSKELSEIENFQQCAFIFGNEEFGITSSILEICDEIIRLPLVGKKNSINVGNVFSIVAHHITNNIA